MYARQRKLKLERQYDEAVRIVAGGDRSVGKWLLVEAHRHRVSRAPGGAWGAYCPKRGPNDLIYAATFSAIQSLFDTPCPHIDYRYRPYRKAA